MDLASIISAVAWPSLVWWLLNRTYADEIKSMLQRIKGGTIAGNTLDIIPVQQLGAKAEVQSAISETVEAAQAEAPEKEKKLPVSPSSQESEMVLKQLSRDYPNDYESQSVVATNLFIGAHLNYRYEVAYRNIYGSQIRFLRVLNSSYRTNREAAISYYSNLNPSPAQIGSNFNAWLEFMIQANLIMVVGEQIEITDFGRGFLNYMTNSRLSEFKAY